MKYFALQCKRVFKLLPFVLLIAALLIAAMAVLLVNWAGKRKEENKAKFQIGIVGTADSSFYQWGLAAIQTMDSSRYSLRIEQMSESEAKKRLLNGTLKAYVVIPEDFVKLARVGKIKTIPYYTTVGSKGVGSILKDEFTDVISRVLEESQKGAYGLYDLLYEHTNRQLAESESDALSFRYVEIILNRSSLYGIAEAGVYDGLNFFQYLLSGFSVLVFGILLLPFASLYIKRDLSFHRILASRAQSPAGQIAAEYGALFCAVLVLSGLLLTVVKVAYDLFGSYLEFQIGFDVAGFALCMIPALALLTAFAFMIFVCSGNMISGVVMYFFGFVFLSYVSGCAYPIYMLPDVLQKAARFLPMGAARGFAASGMTGKADLPGLLTVLGMTALFLAVSLLVRRGKLYGKGD